MFSIIMNGVWIFIKAGFLKHGMLLKFVYFIKHLRFIYNKEEENLPGPPILDNKLLVMVLTFTTEQAGMGWEK